MNLETFGISGQEEGSAWWDRIYCGFWDKLKPLHACTACSGPSSWAFPAPWKLQPPLWAASAAAECCGFPSVDNLGPFIFPSGKNGFG